MSALTPSFNPLRKLRHVAVKNLPKLMGMINDRAGSSRACCVMNYKELLRDYLV